MSPGDRVTTPHGAGTVVRSETVDNAWPGMAPQIIGTGRLAVKLDVWPFLWHSADDVAYYWPTELEKLT